MLTIKFEPGTKVHVQILSNREKTEDGHVLFVGDGPNRRPVMEEFVHREFDAEIDGVTVTRDGDGVLQTQYHVTHEVAGAAQTAWVDERFVHAIEN
jgi:hypothetical protein